MLLFTDYFQEGIFYANSYGEGDELELIGLMYSLFQNPEKTVEQWHQKFLENKKKAERDS